MTLSREPQAYLEHELPHSLLSLLTIRIRSHHRALSRSSRPTRRRSLKRRIRRARRIGVHEEHEFDIAARQHAVDVIVLERIDALEISA